MAYNDIGMADGAVGTDGHQNNNDDGDGGGAGAMMPMMMAGHQHPSPSTHGGTPLMHLMNGTASASANANGIMDSEAASELQRAQGEAELCLVSGFSKGKKMAKMFNWIRHASMALKEGREKKWCAPAFWGNKNLEKKMKREMETNPPLNAELLNYFALPKKNFFRKSSFF